MNSNVSPNGAGGDLVQRIQERYSALRKSERIVADYLRENAGTRLNYSITEFASVLGLSEATISRVSRALGYSGYPDLKLSLAEGAANRSGIANIPEEIAQSDTLIGTSGKLANLLTHSIQGTQRMLDAERIEHCLKAIQTARRVVLVGVGGAAAICDEASHLFMKAGIDATSYNDAYTQIIAAANLGSDCLMIGISHTGMTDGVARALTLAGENGARTIAITSDPSSPVAAAAQTVLTTWNSSTPSVHLHGDFLEGRISQLFLIDLLYVGLLFETETDRAHHLRVTADALQQYFRTDG
jgi:RpiR family transcriptional regulator, carbohydrate utilization regulator